MKRSLIICIFFIFGYGICRSQSDATAWIRINQFGYLPQGIKVAVWGSKASQTPADFKLVDANTSKVIFKVNYVSTDSVLESVRRYEIKPPEGLNGFILLFHIGTDPRRTDRAYAGYQN